MRPALARTAEAGAVVAGMLLLVATLVTCASVVRGLFGQPILGDSEIVEMCMGVAVALCLPFAEMRGGHVIVDVFTARMAPPRIAWLDAAMRAGVALVAAVLAARLAVGAYDQWDRERNTMFLELPYWVGYAIAACALLLWTAAASLVAAERLHAARRA